MDGNSGRWKRWMKKVLGYAAFFLAYITNYCNLFVLKLP